MRILGALQRRARSAKVLVTLPLTVRSGALAQLADLVADTRNTKFRHFRTIPEIATTYGAAVPNVATDERILAHDGLKLALDPTDGAFWVASRPRRPSATSAPP